MWIAGCSLTPVRPDPTATVERDPPVNVKTTLATPTDHWVTLATEVYTTTTTMVSAVETITPTGLFPLTDFPLLIPRIHTIELNPDHIRVQVAFELAPNIPRSDSSTAEIYDASLADQDGRIYQLNGTERVGPWLAAATFSPLQPGSNLLFFKAQFVAVNIPADAPLNMDLRGRSIGARWRINESLRFGDLRAPLHTAGISLAESGSQENYQKQAQFEMWGTPVRLGGAQLLCLNLNPLQVQPGESGCSAEPQGIWSATTIGPVVGQEEPLLAPNTVITLSVSADFLVDETWQTTLPLEK